MDILYENKTYPVSFGIQKILSSIPHLHKQLEIIYVKSGIALAYADEKKYRITSGDVFITFPNQVHYYNTIENGEYYVMIFSPENIVEMSSILLGSIPENNIVNVSYSKRILEIIKKIRKTEGKYVNIILNGYYNILMGYLFESLNLIEIDNENKSSLHSIIAFCSDNFEDDITLDTIADNLHLSKYYISHVINKNLKLNFNDYINNLRINEACLMLREGNLKITDISERVGFGTIRTFNRCFLKTMNITPQEYRNQNSIKKSVV